MLLLIGSRGTVDAAGRHGHRPGERLPRRRRVVDPAAGRASACTRRSQLSERASRAQGGPADRSRSLLVGLRVAVAARRSAAVVVASPTRTAASRTSSCVVAALFLLLDVRPRPHAVRPPRLRGRRQRRGGAARGHQRRPGADRVLRDLLDDGGDRRHRAGLAPALGRHRTPAAATILLYSIAAAVIGGTSLFGGRGHVKSRGARRARHRVDRQRARACSGWARARSS